MTHSTASRRKRSYDPQGTRRRILDVAASEFQNRGYHATSMHDVMRVAVAPGGSVYHYFPTKKSLGLAVINERVAEMVAETWIEPIRTASNTLAAILSVFETVANDIERGDGSVSGCPLNNLTLELSLIDPDFQRALSGVFSMWGLAIAQRLRADLEAGRLDKIRPDELATFIVASFSGAMALAKASQSVEPIRTCTRELARVLR